VSETTFSVSMRTASCGTCGIPYAVPAALGAYDCPGCARRLRRGIEEERDSAFEDLLHKDRQIAALKGVIARKRRRSP
jgi:hypothetical protein